MGLSFLFYQRPNNRFCIGFCMTLFAENTYKFQGLFKNISPKLCSFVNKGLLFNTTLVCITDFAYRIKLIVNA